MRTASFPMFSCAIFPAPTHQLKTNSLKTMVVWKPAVSQPLKTGEQVWGSIKIPILKKKIPIPRDLSLFDLCGILWNSHSQVLSLFDVIQSMFSVRSALEAIIKNNQWQLFNTAAASDGNNNWGRETDQKAHKETLKNEFSQGTLNSSDIFLGI